MRRHGAVATTAGLGVNDHVCWTYDDVRDFLDVGVGYLDEGRRAGLRLMYVSSRTAEQMRADVTPLRVAERLLAEGGLALITLSDLFDSSRPRTVERDVFGMQAATTQALAAGYAGLRVLADATELITDPRRRADQLRWEHLADRYMGSGHPMSALCGYDRRVAGDAAVADVAVLHPLVGTPREVPARVFFDGDRLVLAGFVDAFNCVQVDRLLTACQPADGSVVLHLGELEFIDVRGLCTLVDWGRRLASGGGKLHLQGASGLVRRMWRILGFDVPGVTLEGAA